MQYLITLKDLPEICDGCGKIHTLNHALQCKVDSLISGSHNELQDNLDLITTQPFPPTPSTITQSSPNAEMARK
eukprot:6785044-Ditylum_brightwellii.AAC.1